MGRCREIAVTRGLAIAKRNKFRVAVLSHKTKYLARCFTASALFTASLRLWSVNRQPRRASKSKSHTDSKVIKAWKLGGKSCALKGVGRCPLCGLLCIILGSPSSVAAQSVKPPDTSKPICFDMSYGLELELKQCGDK